MLSAFFIGILLYRRQTVCIDPGHPSEVGRGTHGRKLTELHANWLMSKALEKLLIHKGIRVVLTKGAEEEFVKNRQRAEIANASHADLLIRLHCDGSTSSGYTVYYPDLPGKDGAFEGPSAEVRGRSKAAAYGFHVGFKKGGVTLRDNGVKSDRSTAVGAKHGALVASIHSKVPVVLIEMATLKVRKDEDFMASRRGQRTMADALEKGVEGALAALKNRKTAKLP